ncbi:MAG: hypothetical protein JWM46_165 [Candidatus Kaiserbacteria bacterium]|nr:hypothetical protein [Candidatus Kaiserbacteria bacterium]
MKMLIRLYYMSTRAAFIISLSLIALTLAIGLYYYAALPAVMAGHWDAAGVANGTISKFWGVTLLPLLMFVILWVLVVVARIDPLRSNIEAFRGTYNTFLTILMLFFAGVQIAVLAVNLGVKFNIDIAIMPLVGILFFYIGTVLPRTKRNYFMGVRTPWTVSSDIVWDKTNRLGGTLFKVLGVLAILTVLAPSYAIVAFAVPTVIVVFGLVLYSYVAYREAGVRAH